MARYRKLFVASVGLIVLVLSDLLGVELGPEAEGSAVSLFDALVVFLTAIGVERVPNAPEVLGRGELRERIERPGGV